MIARISTRHLLRGVLAALLALVVAGAPGRSLAQAPAVPPQNASPAAVALARQIIELKGARQGMFEPLVRGVIEKVKEQFLQTNFNLAPELNVVAANLQKEYAPRAGQLETVSAQIYARHFTEGELTQILAFYKSPVGQKVIREEPRALDETMANAGAWGDALSEEIVAKMRAEMKKRGHDL
jgi:hypothetical protein